MTRLLAIAVVVLTACSAQGIALETNRSLTLLAPTDGGTVAMPFSVQWRVDNAALRQQLASGARRLAIFFDRSPMPPGETFHAVADKECRQTPGCPDTAYLTDRDIFVATASSLPLSSFQVDDLPDTRTPHQRKDQHQLTIVVVDASGRRVGEAAFEAEFDISRPPETL